MDPTERFQQVWGAAFTEQAGALDELLTAQLEAGRPVPDAPFAGVAVMLLPVVDHGAILWH